MLKLFNKTIFIQQYWLISWVTYEFKQYNASQRYEIQQKSHLWINFQHISHHNYFFHKDINDMKKNFLNYNSKYTFLHNSASYMTIFFAVKKDSLFVGLCINQMEFSMMK